MTEGKSHLQTPIPVTVREGRFYIDGGSDDGYTTRDKAIAAVGLTPVTSRGDVSRREVSQTDKDLMDELEGATVDDGDENTGSEDEPPASDAPETDPNEDDSGEGSDDGDEQNDGNPESEGDGGGQEESDQG